MSETLIAALERVEQVAETLDTVRHPTRMKVLVVLSQEKVDRSPDASKKEGGLSPNDIRQLTGVTLGAMAYHVRTLRNKGLVKLRREARVRGAVEHFYELTPAGQRAANAVMELV